MWLVTGIRWFGPQVAMPQDRAFRGRVRDKVQGLEANIELLSRLHHPNIVRYLVRC